MIQEFVPCRIRLNKTPCIFHFNIYMNRRPLAGPIVLPNNLNPPAREMQTTEIAPFPYPFGLGTDICHIPRIRQILTSEKPQYAERFAQKIFGPAERGEFNSRYQKLLQCKRDGLETVPASAIDSLVRDKCDQKLWQLSSWVAGR